MPPRTTSKTAAEPESKTEPEIFVCSEAFWGDVDGVPTHVQKGERVRRGHRLLELHGSYFRPAGDGVEYDIERATAAPGEKRGE